MSGVRAGYFYPAPKCCYTGHFIFHFCCSPTYAPITYHLSKQDGWSILLPSPNFLLHDSTFHFSFLLFTYLCTYHLSPIEARWLVHTFTPSPKCCYMTAHFIFSFLLFTYLCTYHLSPMHDTKVVMSCYLVCLIWI